MIAKYSWHVFKTTSTLPPRLDVGAIYATPRVGRAPGCRQGSISSVCSQPNEHLRQWMQYYMFLAHLYRQNKVAHTNQLSHLVDSESFAQVLKRRAMLHQRASRLLNKPWDVEGGHHDESSCNSIDHSIPQMRSFNWNGPSASTTDLNNAC